MRGVKMQPAWWRAGIRDAKDDVVFLGELDLDSAGRERLTAGGQDTKGDCLLLETRTMGGEVFERDRTGFRPGINQAQRGGLCHRDAELEMVGAEDRDGPDFEGIVGADWKRGENRDEDSEK